MKRQLLAGVMLGAIVCAGVVIAQDTKPQTAADAKAKADAAAAKAAEAEAAAKEAAEAAEAAKAAALAEANAKLPAWLKSNKQKVSYFFGTRLAQQLMQNGVAEVDTNAFAKGVSDALGGAEPQVSIEQVQAAFVAYQKEMEDKRKAQAELNRKAGAAFLAKNGKAEGVVTTKSGLQYKELKNGDGKKPTTKDTVKVHYHGTLADGTVFDSSVKRGEPIEFPVTGVIKGWTEALLLMQVGDKWKLWIPADLAYGDNPRPGGAIKPGHMLIFEVELLDTKPTPQRPQFPGGLPPR